MLIGILLKSFDTTENLWQHDIFVSVSSLPHSHHIFKYKCLIESHLVNTVKLTNVCVFV